MKDTRVVKDESGKIDLCETFTDEANKVLKQVETDTVYGSSVIDVIAGYYDDEKPYSRYTYEEVNGSDEEVNSL